MIEKLYDMIGQADRLIDDAANEAIDEITIDTSPKLAAHTVRIKAHRLMLSLANNLLREERAAPAPSGLPWVKIVEGGPRPEPKEDVLLLWPDGAWDKGWIQDGDWYSHDESRPHPWGAWGETTFRPTHYLVITRPED